LAQRAEIATFTFLAMTRSGGHPGQSGESRGFGPVKIGALLKS
jgi:hypothetical protein